MKRSSVFWERMILLASVIGLAISGSYLISSSSKIKNVDVKSGSIGYVRPLGSDVRVRGLKDVEWNAVRNDANVYQQDKVYTGQSSSAVVSLRSKQKLMVRPNSLIVITDGDDVVRVDLGSGGGFLSEIKKGMRLLVKKDNTETQIEGDGTVVQFESGDKNEIKFVVLKGTATVKSEDHPEPVQVAANQEVKVVQKQIDLTPLSIQLLTPGPGDVLWNQNLDVQFKWDVKGNSEQNQKFTVEVSDNPLFPANSTLRKEAFESSTSFPITPGSVFFWRVKSRDPATNLENISATSSFSFFDLRPPIVAEKSEVTIKKNWLGSAQYPVVFGWVDLSLSDSFSFQISSEKDFSKVLYEDLVEKNSISLSKISEGEFYWRVISHKEGRKDLVSNIGQVKVTTDASSEMAPTEETPTTAPEKRTLAEETPKDISEPPSEQVAEPVLSPPMKTPEPEKTKPPVEVAKERLATPRLTKFDLNEDTSSQQALLTWKGTADSGSYEVQISEDAKFRQKEKITVQDQQYHFDVSGPKTYFARVRSLSDGESLSSRFSNVMKLSVPELEKPLAEESPTQESEPALASDQEQTSAQLADPTSRAGEESDDTHYLYDPKWSAYLGSGVDYLTFSQNGNSGSDTGSFASLAPATLLLGVNARLTPKTRLRLEYHRWPGKFSSDASTPINTTDYMWTSTIAEGQYRFSESSHKAYDLLFGVQRHQVPYLSGNSGGTIDVLQNSLLNVSLGMQFKYLSESKKYEYEIYGRYQYLLSSSNEDGYQFKASPELMFDGSIGASRLFDNGLKAGVYWFGQQQSFKYDFTRDGTTSSGEQSFFNSNIQFRLEWGFYSFLCVTTGPLLLGFRRRRKKKVKSS